jgi:hypothetical protein
LEHLGHGFLFGLEGKDKAFFEKRKNKNRNPLFLEKVAVLYP